MIRRTYLPGLDSAAATTVKRGQHAISRLVQSHGRRARVFRLLVLSAGALLALGGFVQAVQSLGFPQIYRRDFLQEYLLARALADGASLYLPLPELAQRYLGTLPVQVLPHASPHPPPVAVLFLPLAALDYALATTIWLGLEAVFLPASVYLLGRAARPRPPAWAVLACSVALVGWFPFSQDLIYGQLMLLLLLLLAGSQLALLLGRPALSGTLVGLSVLVKPVAWPLILLFALRKDWRALGASVLAIMVGYAIVISVTGLGTIAAYVMETSRIVDAYHAYSNNFSLWTLGWRFFDGTGSSIFLAITAPPLLESAPAARVGSLAIPALALLGAGLVARRLRSSGSAFGVMVCVSILVSPIAWNHYLVLVAVPATYVIGWLARRGFPRKETNASLIVAGLLLVPDVFWKIVALVISGQGDKISNSALATQAGAPNVLATIPFAPALLTLMPAITIGVLAWLVAYLGAKENSEVATLR